MNFFEIQLQRVVVDDNCATLEGFMKQIYPGSVAASTGMADDPDADYLMVFRMLVVIPVRQDGLMEGEDAYTSGPASVTRLSREELPREYIDLAHATG